MLFCHYNWAITSKRGEGNIKPNDRGLNELLLRNINKAIKETGLSMQEIAQRLGVNYSTVWRILHGKRGIKPEIIAELAYMTYRTPNDFFYAKD